MNISIHRTRGLRAVVLSVLALTLSGASAAGGPGAAAFSSMMQAWSAGSFDDAIKAADAVLKAEPANVEYLNAIGSLYCEKAQKANVLTKLSWAKKCRSTWERAVVIDPKSFDVNISLLRYYLQAPGIAGGGMDKAKSLAAKASAVEPLLGEIVWGHIARSENHLDEAERRYRKAAEIDPSGMRGPAELANFYSGQKRWTDARSLYETRLAKNAGDTFASYQLGRLMLIEGVDFAKALDLFDRYLAQPAPAGGPTHADAWFRKGQVLDKLGKRADAIAALEAALKLVPAHAGATRELKRLKG